MVAPPIYLTGYLEFQDTLGKNLSEAYVGQLPAKDVLKKTEDEWNAIVRRIGRSQAQGRARELQGGDAEAQPAGVTCRRRASEPDASFIPAGRVRPSGLPAGVHA